MEREKGGTSVERRGPATTDYFSTRAAEYRVKRDPLSPGGTWQGSRQGATEKKSLGAERGLFKSFRVFSPFFEKRKSLPFFMCVCVLST